MSTLTKTLVILLTLSSFVLCGFVVSYVANVDNYKDKYNKLKSGKDSVDRKVDSLTTQVNEKIAEKNALEDKLNGEIASLKKELDELKVSLADSEREKAALLQKVNNWASITKDFSATTDKQNELLTAKLEELKDVRAEQIKQSKELEETTRTLMEKMAIINTLETEKKNLIEKNTELQAKLNNVIQPSGQVTTAVPEQMTVYSSAPLVKDIDLKGLISEVDMKNSMASISLGSADGVRNGMVFYATRGDKFICEILIIDVQEDKALGILQRAAQQPQIGDTVSSNL